LENFFALEMLSSTEFKYDISKRFLPKLSTLLVDPAQIALEICKKVLTCMKFPERVYTKHSKYVMHKITKP
jgi:hypothetical protein